MGFLSSLALPGVYRDSLDSYLEVIESLNGEIADAEKKAARALEKSPEARLLSTIPGVGLITSLMITAEIGDVSRFASHRQLCSFAGLVALHLAVGRDNQARTDNQAGLSLAALRAGGGVQARGREARSTGGFLRQAGQTQGQVNGEGGRRQEAGHLRVLHAARQQGLRRASLFPKRRTRVSPYGFLG